MVLFLLFTFLCLPVTAHAESLFDALTDGQLITPVVILADNDPFNYWFTVVWVFGMTGFVTGMFVRLINRS